MERGKSKLGVELLCTEMIIVCKFHDPSIIGSRDTVGGGGGVGNSMLCRRCSLCSRRNRKINIVLGESGENVSKTQKIAFYCQEPQHFCRSL